MEYAEEQLKMGYEVTDFLNKHNISKENIVAIYTSKYFHHLIYLRKKRFV